MVLTLGGLRGAVGFLTRLPVGSEPGDWAAFRREPVAFPLVGYLVGGLLVPVLVLPAPALTVAAVFVVWVYVVTGINHVDGVADLGDAMVVHGPPADRRAVMTDTTAGVGAVLAVALVVAGLALGAIPLAAGAVGAVGVVVAAEVGAKLGMVAVVGLGSPTHDGLGADVAEPTRARHLVLAALVALPAGLATWPHPAAAVALAGALGAALVVLVWARARLGGVSGDVAGAANEVARVVAIHAGVVAWTRF